MPTCHYRNLFSHPIPSHDTRPTWQGTHITPSADYTLFVPGGECRPGPGMRLHTCLGRDETTASYVLTLHRKCKRPGGTAAEPRCGYPGKMHETHVSRSPGSRGFLVSQITLGWPAAAASSSAGQTGRTEGNCSLNAGRTPTNTRAHANREPSGRRAPRVDPMPVVGGLVREAGSPPLQQHRPGLNQARPAHSPRLRSRPGQRLRKIPLSLPPDP